MEHTDPDAGLIYRRAILSVRSSSKASSAWCTDEALRRETANQEAWWTAEELAGNHVSLYKNSLRYVSFLGLEKETLQVEAPSAFW